MSRSFKRFFTTQLLPYRTDTVTLDERESHYLKNVLRLQSGERCIVLGRFGEEWSGKVIRSTDRKAAQIELLERHERPRGQALSLTIAQAIPQRAKMDTIVEKAAELGVDRLVPMISERTMVRMKPEVFTKARERWERIVWADCKQSRSQVITEVSDPLSFDEVVGIAQEASRAILLHPESNQTIFELFNELKSDAPSSSRNIFIMIGPEGGFSSQEIERAIEKRMTPVRLGHTILKTDTAFVAIASLFSLVRS